MHIPGELLKKSAWFDDVIEWSRDKDFVFYGHHIDVRQRCENIKKELLSVVPGEWRNEFNEVIDSIFIDSASSQCFEELNEILDEHYDVFCDEDDFIINAWPVNEIRIDYSEIFERMPGSKHAVMQDVMKKEIYEPKNKEINRVIFRVFMDHFFAKRLPSWVSAFKWIEIKLSS